MERDARRGYGAEDVLAGQVPQLPAPAPRTRFRRKRDYAAAATIAVVALVAALLITQTSDQNATASQTAPAAKALAAPQTFPPSLAEVWQAPSGATNAPVVAGPAVATAQGGEVLGRDPLTGDVRWRYSRDLRLCTVAAGFADPLVLAVYRKDDNLLPSDDPRAAGGCSEVTGLDPDTGKRARQRNSDAELGTRLIGDGTYVTATGERLMTTWRSDLVLTMQYGAVPAIVNPKKQRVNPESDPADRDNACTYVSTAVSSGDIGVVERCTKDNGDRFTVYKATNKDSDQPEVVSSTVVGGKARVIALNDDHAVLALPDPDRLVVLDAKGAQLTEYPLQLAPTDLLSDPAGGVVSTAKGPGAVYWFTGSGTIALSETDFHPLWAAPGTLGPGVLFAGRTLMPVPGGIRVLDPVGGTVVGTIPVDRGNYVGPVTMSTIGPMVLEQRGRTVVALR